MHLLELLFFAIIAFLIISKLIATLGSTNEEDASKYKSFFGEKSTIKDVTNTASYQNSSNQTAVANPFNNENLDDIIVKDNKENIVLNLLKLQSKLTNFSGHKFVKAAKTAFGMILAGLSVGDDRIINTLVDKRYVEKFQELSYDKIDKVENLKAKISDLYLFGNNVFIKILFSGASIFEKRSHFKEEWTFTKSLIEQGPDWYLSNVEQI